MTTDKPKVSFLASAAMADVSKAAGIGVSDSDIPICPLVIGDVITWRAAPALFFTVVTRIFRPGSEGQPGEWMVGLEPAPDPFARFDA